MRRVEQRSERGQKTGTHESEGRREERDREERERERFGASENTKAATIRTTNLAQHTERSQNSLNCANLLTTTTNKE